MKRNIIVILKTSQRNLDLYLLNRVAAFLLNEEFKIQLCSLPIRMYNVYGVKNRLFQVLGARNRKEISSELNFACKLLPRILIHNT